MNPKQIVNTMCGSDEPHPYPVRTFTYHTEQARPNEVQRVIVYRVFHFKHKTKYEVHKSNNTSLIGQHEPDNCTLKNKILPPCHVCSVSHILVVADCKLLWLAAHI